MAATKRALWGALELGLTDACRAGAQELVGMWGHPDQEEGPRAFAEKREAQWAASGAGPRRTGGLIGQTARPTGEDSMTDGTTEPTRAGAPEGDLATYERTRSPTTASPTTVYRKGSGPVVIVITEMPGISPMVVGFADRVVALGCTAVLPDLFGDGGQGPETLGKRRGRSGYGLQVDGRRVHQPGVLDPGRRQVVAGRRRGCAPSRTRSTRGRAARAWASSGMCFTGGFALAMAVDDLVLAPVMSQPSLPFRDRELAAGRHRHERRRPRRS